MDAIVVGTRDFQNYNHLPSNTELYYRPTSDTQMEIKYIDFKQSNEIINILMNESVNELTVFNCLMYIILSGSKALSTLLSCQRRDISERALHKDAFVGLSSDQNLAYSLYLVLFISFFSDSDK